MDLGTASALLYKRKSSLFLVFAGFVIADMGIVVAANDSEDN
jgi:hypothetical protein